LRFGLFVVILFLDLLRTRTPPPADESASAPLTQFTCFSFFFSYHCHFAVFLWQERHLQLHLTTLDVLPFIRFVLDFAPQKCPKMSCVFRPPVRVPGHRPRPPASPYEIPPSLPFTLRSYFFFWFSFFFFYFFSVFSFFFFFFFLSEIFFFLG